MLDFNNMDDEIVCPYCGYGFSDSWEYGEGEAEIECKCGKSFHYYGEVVLNMKVAKDCKLNGEEHSFKINRWNSELKECSKCGYTELNSLKEI